MIFAFTHFLLVLPVLFVNYKFYHAVFKHLARFSPPMYPLFSMGSGAAFLYGIYSR